MKKLSFCALKVTMLSFFLFAIAPVIAPIASDAFASTTADSNALVDAMCNAFSIVTGSAGKAFAAFAIISVGIGFFTGKVSWGLMIGVAAGIAAMFGAPSIVAVISGENAFNCP
jgi:type IV secretion system protein VirB2